MDKEEILFEVRTNEHTSEVAVILVIRNSIEGIDFVATLASVKEQILKSIDILVVVDGLNEQDIVLVYAWLTENRPSFGDLLLIKTDLSEQTVKVINMGLHYTRAPYIFMLDSNAILYPRCLDSLLRGIKNANASFTHCYIEIFGAQKGIFNAYPWNAQTLKVGNSADTFILIKRCTMEQAVCCPGERNELADYELWKNSIENGGTRILIPEILMRYKVKLDSLYKPIVSPHE